MLSKALSRRKNILTYIRHVAPRDNNRAQVEKNLERYKIELDVLNAHIEAMQDEMKVLKRQLSDKGVSFTLKAVKPVEPRKRPEKSPYVANGKMAFDDAQKAQVAADIDALVNSAGWQQALADKGWLNTYLAGDDFQAQLAVEIETTTQILKDIGLVQ